MLKLFEFAPKKANSTILELFMIEKMNIGLEQSKWERKFGESTVYYSTCTVFDLQHGALRHQEHANVV
jgi:hypothetical protein